MRQNINKKLIDLYELTMGQVYWKQGLPNATFSLFFRPDKKRSYFILAGIDELVDQIKEFRFEDDYINYLESLRLFDKKYLSYLSTFRFDGLIRSMRNGSLFFPMESILEISGNILECQLLETLIINEIHSNTSLATKSSRIVQSSGNSTVIDFSARRTYGYNAALKASKNAYISGFEGTSNVDAGKMFGIPLIGTMGHSYVLSFKNEYQSFLNYAKEFKNNSTFLIDTYDSLKGIKNAIDVHKNEGKDVHSIRLDSGDIKELSFKARQMLDAAGLKSTKIIATGSMDEYKINELINNQKCPIDIFGVGSNLGVSSDTPVLECVYKLVEIENNPVNKLSPNKSYFPYSKQVHRKIDDNLMNHDVVTRSNMVKDGYSSMIKNIYEKGEYIEGTDSINKVRNYVKSQLEQLPEENKNIEIQQEYSVIFEI